MGSAEQREKRARIKALLEERGLDGVILRKGANIAWIIGGRAHIPTTLELACMDVIVYRDRIVVVTNKIEAPRLSAEELTGDEELVVVNWFEGRDAQLPASPSIGIDGADPVRVNLSSEIENLRRELNSHEVERLRSISSDASDALSQALNVVEPSDTEVEVAGEIADQLWQRNLEPVVLLVSGKNRISHYRHPLPTTEVIGDTVMGVICARRKGLIASITRIVNFGELSSQASDDYEKLLHVEARFLDATRSGAKLSDVFKKGVAGYIEEGFDRDEWTKHHQGGSTGYMPRDFPAHEKTDQLIAINNAIAWNPSARGLKVEDTGIATPEGIELLSVTGSWPTTQVAGRARPAILIR